MAFNQIEYQQKYNKEHYVQVKVDIPKEIKEELVAICNRKGISIRQFILNSIQEAKKNQK